MYPGGRRVTSCTQPACRKGIAINRRKPSQATKSAPVLLDAFYLKNAMPYYLKGTVLIPRSKWKYIHYFAKLPATPLAKSWMKIVRIAYRRNLAKKMSKERAALIATAEAFKKWKIRYKNLPRIDPFTQSLNTIPLLKPHYFLKYRRGACADFATLAAATFRYLGMNYALIVNDHHAISAIIRPRNSTSPKDLTPEHVARARLPGGGKVDFYPLDISASGSQASLAKMFKLGVGSLRDAIVSSGFVIVDQGGHVLLRRSKN